MGKLVKQYLLTVSEYDNSKFIRIIGVTKLLPIAQEYCKFKGYTSRINAFQWENPTEPNLWIDIEAQYSIEDLYAIEFNGKEKD